MSSQNLHRARRHADRPGGRGARDATVDAHRRAVALLRASVDEAVRAARPSVGDLGGAAAGAARTMLPAADEPTRDDRR
ncbi:hypothetical protein [Cellulomonas persica]|uniref:hypothetical protein n=1 Tax=Cellulomonas persica TaxID=76861 RepID=UPI0011BE5CD4|nr:hypothetical protein [Cellulomonas persica]